MAPMVGGWVVTVDFVVCGYPGGGEGGGEDGGGGEVTEGEVVGTEEGESGGV